MDSIRLILLPLDDMFTGLKYQASIIRGPGRSRETCGRRPMSLNRRQTCFCPPSSRARLRETDQKSSIEFLTRIYGRSRSYTSGRSLDVPPSIPVFQSRHGCLRWPKIYPIAIRRCLFIARLPLRIRLDNDTPLARTSDSDSSSCHQVGTQAC